MKLDTILKRIESRKIAIGKHRDKLRELHSDLGSEIESIDGAMDNLDQSQEFLAAALDEMSQYL